MSLVERKVPLTRLSAEKRGGFMGVAAVKQRARRCAGAVLVLEDSWAFDAPNAVAEVRRVWVKGAKGCMLNDAEAPYVRNGNAAWMKTEGENAHRWMSKTA